MNSRIVPGLQRTLSRERLEAYRPVNGSDLDMLANYFWDIDLAEALVPCLHAAELALRNSIHEAISHQQQTEQWYYLPGLLQPGQLGDVSRALGQLSRRKSQPTPGRIVAELTSGFWVTLLSDPYEQPIWQPQSFALLRRVFPNCPRPHRQDIHKRFNEIRKLRNRVFHFEAVWNRPNLLQEHDDILEAVRWISLPLYQAIDSVDNFKETYHNRENVRVHLQKLLQPPSAMRHPTRKTSAPLYDPIDYLGVPLEE